MEHDMEETLSASTPTGPVAMSFGTKQATHVGLGAKQLMLQGLLLPIICRSNKAPIPTPLSVERGKSNPNPLSVSLRLESTASMCFPSPTLGAPHWAHLYSAIGGRVPHTTGLPLAPEIRILASKYSDFSSGTVSATVFAHSDLHRSGFQHDRPHSGPPGVRPERRTLCARRTRSPPGPGVVFGPKRVSPQSSSESTNNKGKRNFIHQMVFFFGFSYVLVRSCSVSFSCFQSI